MKYDAGVNIHFLTNSTTHAVNVAANLGNINSGAVTLTIGGVGWIFAASTLWFQNWSLADAYDADGNLVGDMNYTLLWRGDGWQEKRPNLSLFQSVNASGTITLNADGTPKTKAIVDSNNQQVSEPRYLNALGVPIANGGSVTMNAFDVKGTSSFTTLLSAFA